MAFAFPTARSCRYTRSAMKTARLLTMLVPAVLLAGCASRSKQAPTPPAPAQKSVPAPMLQTVIIRTNAKCVYVDGEVKVSARFDWTQGLTLTNAIALAGGFTDFANRRRLEIRRGDGSVEHYNYFRIRNGTTNDPALKPNDQIIVPRSWF